MRNFIFGLLFAGVFGFLGAKLHAVATPAPSIAKFNSVVAKKPVALASAGEVVRADGTGKTAWAFVKGTDIDSGQASSGMVLQADGAGKAAFEALSAAPSGAAGGDLSGTYPNPTIAAGAVSAAKLAAGVGVPHPQFTQMYLKAGNGTAANTFTVPAGVTSILIEGWGAGGGGGGGGALASAALGGGGGSGAPGEYFRAVVAVTPGSFTVTVGSGGSAGAGGGTIDSVSHAGTNGGNSTVGVMNGATIFTALGGGGGGGGGPGNPGTAGTAGAAPVTTGIGVQLAVGGSAGASGTSGFPFGGSAVVPVFGLIPALSLANSGAGGVGGTTSNGAFGGNGGDGLVIVSY